MTINIKLGTRWLDQAAVLIIDEHPAEFELEDIFHACNRVDGLAGDIARLMSTSADATWLARLREAIDQHQLPSMSVDDGIWVTAPSGQELGGMVCMFAGWEPLRHTDRSAFLDGCKLIHLAP